MRCSIPKSIKDAPAEVIQAAREIAETTLAVLRQSIKDNVPEIGEDELWDFTIAVCEFMAESA